MKNNASGQRQSRGNMKLRVEVRIRASGMPGKLKTAEEALGVIDHKRNDFGRSS
jgi:hypothetical protein